MSDRQDESDPRFTEDERITENLRLRSISPTARFFLGIFAFVPPKWRGPILVCFFALLGYFGPQLIVYLTHTLGNQSK